MPSIYAIVIEFSNQLERMRFLMLVRKSVLGSNDVLETIKLTAETSRGLPSVQLIFQHSRPCSDTSLILPNAIPAVGEET